MDMRLAPGVLYDVLIVMYTGCARQRQEAADQRKADDQEKRAAKDRARQLMLEAMEQKFLEEKRKLEERYLVTKQANDDKAALLEAEESARREKTLAAVHR